MPGVAEQHAAALSMETGRDLGIDGVECGVVQVTGGGGVVGGGRVEVARPPPDGGHAPSETPACALRPKRRAHFVVVTGAVQFGRAARKCRSSPTVWHFVGDYVA